MITSNNIHLKKSLMITSNNIHLKKSLMIIISDNNM